MFFETLEEEIALAVLREAPCHSRLARANASLDCDQHAFPFKISSHRGFLSRYDRTRACYSPGAFLFTLNARGAKKERSEANIRYSLPITRLITIRSSGQARRQGFWFGLDRVLLANARHSVGKRIVPMTFIDD